MSRLTNNNPEEYDPEIDFCNHCQYHGEPNGCNRLDGECDSYERFLETYYKLREYEDVEEDGFLRRLPCKLGSKFYYLCYDEILEKEVCDISFTADDDIKISSGDGVCYYLGKYGDRIFFNKEDAEKELEKIKG